MNNNQEFLQFITPNESGYAAELTRIGEIKNDHS